MLLLSRLQFFKHIIYNRKEPCGHIIHSNSDLYYEPRSAFAPIFDFETRPVIQNTII
jgi:hypothetical protein